MRTFRKKRAPGDPTTLADYENAKSQLECAGRYFEHLDVLGSARTKLDPAKLKMHIKFCQDQLKRVRAAAS